MNEEALKWLKEFNHFNLSTTRILADPTTLDQYPTLLSRTTRQQLLDIAAESVKRCRDRAETKRLKQCYNISDITPSGFPDPEMVAETRENMARKLSSIFLGVTPSKGPPDAHVSIWGLRIDNSLKRLSIGPLKLKTTPYWVVKPLKSGTLDREYWFANKSSAETFALTVGERMV